MASNPYVLDFSPVTNALAAYQKQKNTDREFAESGRRWEAQNYLAQRSADRADQMAPLQMEHVRAQIESARRQGATEAQLAPLKIQMMKAQRDLYGAQAAAARQKDESSSRIMTELFGTPPYAGTASPPLLAPGAGPAPMNGNAGETGPVRRQSFNGPPPLNYLAPTRGEDAGPQPQLIQTGGGAGLQRNVLRDGLGGNVPVGPVDPNVILTQGSPSPVLPSNAQPSAAELIRGMSPARKAQFGLSWMGKGDAAKILGEEADRERLSKEARNKIDEQELVAVNSIGRLKQIASGYKDEFLTIEGKLKQYGVSWLDSFESLRGKLKPEELAKHAEFVAFQRDAFENLTQGIKDATGAAMGIQEEARIRKGLPDPQKDGPTAFKSKLFSSINSLELAVQRTRFLRQNGFIGDANAAAARMPLHRFEGLLKDSRALYQRMKSTNPNADDGAIRDAVRRQIRAKYRIDA